MKREQILSLKLPSETLSVPEWEGNVVVRALSAGEYLALVDRVKHDAARAVYHWIAAATFDESGARVFTDDDASALETSLAYPVVERLIEAILKLNPQKDVAAKN